MGQALATTHDALPSLRPFKLRVPSGLGLVGAQPPVAYVGPRHIYVLDTESARLWSAPSRTSLRTPQSTRAALPTALPREHNWRPPSIDHVLTTWALCSIPDVDPALSEIRRVLRPGGSFHVVEHGRSPDPKVAGWQDRLTRIQRRVAGGCHLDRSMDQLVRNSGLEVIRLENYYAKGPRPFDYMFEGVATKS